MIFRTILGRRRTSAVAARAAVLLVVILATAACRHKPGHRLGTASERWPFQDPKTRHPSLLIVGDSIMEQWGPSLQSRHRGILNHGIGGYKMTLIAENFQADALDYHPRAVLIEGGINDVMGGDPVEGVIERREALVRRAAAAGIKVYLANMTPFDPERCAPVESVGRQAVARIDAASQALCATGACTLVDFRAALGGDFDQSLFEDCVHPNLRANARMTKAFEAVYDGF